PAVPRQGAGGQKERHGRERQPDLLGEHPAEDDQVPVPNENVDDSVHYAPAGYQVDPAGALRKDSALTVFSVGDARLPSVPRICRLSGARGPATPAWPHSHRKIMDRGAIV